MGDAPRPGLRVSHILALAVVAAAGALLVARFLIAVSGDAEVGGKDACLALQPEIRSTPAPGFTLPDLEGKKRSLAESRGKVVLLNFWATWCPPCVEELPSMAQLQRALADRPDVAMMTVSVDDTAAQVKKFLEQHRALFGSIPVLMDPSKKVPESYGTKKFPESYLIDRTGTVRYRFINKRDWSSPLALSCIESLL